MKKRILAFILCLSMICGMIPVSTYAVSDEEGQLIGCEECGETEGHLKTCSQYESVCTCTPVDDVHQEGCDFYVEPQTQKCEYCGVELTEGAEHVENCLTRCTCEPVNGVHQSGCIFAPVEESTGIKVGDKIWIKSGSLTYKDVDTSSASYEVTDSYETKIISVIEKEDGSIWYEFERNSLIVQLFDAYKYVQAENVTTEEIKEEEIFCTCDAEEGKLHDKDCPMYYKSVYNGIMQAETVDEYTAISCMMDEVETEMFRQWVKEQDLWEIYSDHVDQVLSTYTVLTRRRLVRTTVSPATTRAVTQSDAVKVEKSAVYNEKTNEVTITLDTYTTGMIQEGQILPADTVLVLDTSGSMAWDYYGTRVGTPMYGDRFNHSSGNYWGWLGNTHLVNGQNPYVLLPDGTFERAAYAGTDNNKVEWFRVESTGEYFYPKMQTESIVTVPREHDYPVYQLYSSTEENTYKITTGIPIFGTKFENGGTWYGWINDTHGSPYIQMDDGNMHPAVYSRTDENGCEIFAYIDYDTNEKFEFYPVLDTKTTNDGVPRAENLKIVQLYSGSSTSRMAALHDAVAEFLRMTAQNNEQFPEGSGSRVSLVQFSCDLHGGTAPTKVLTNLEEITMDNVDAKIKYVYGIVDGGPNTHTEIGDGMELANQVLAKANRTSYKAVIAFTDGKPECDETSGGGFSYIQSNKAIAEAEKISNQGGVVYTICIQDYANVNAGGALPSNDGKGINDDKNNINRLMHLISSNYPDATDMENPGEGSTSGGHYLVPGSDMNLVDIFKQLGEQVGQATISLGAQASIKDYVTPYFEFLEGASVTISVKDAYYEDGELKWKNSTMSNADSEKISYTVDSETKMVSVTGFDFNKNFVAETGRQEGDVTAPGDFHGRKIVVAFTVKPEGDFLGGNGVSTNVYDTSGVYDDSGELVKNYPEPDVDIPLKTVEPEFKTGDIYVGELAVVPHIANVGHFTYGENNSNHIMTDGINNKYVNITYTISDKPFDKNGVTEGNSITYTLSAGTAHNCSDDHSTTNWSTNPNFDMSPLLTNDATYYVCAVVTPIDEGDYGATVATGDQTINVYMPHITFQDSEIKWGETANYDGNDSGNTVTQNYVKVEWKHQDNTADVTTMGVAPVLLYTYDVNPSTITADTPVKVTKIMCSEREGGADNGFEHEIDENLNLLQYATFYRQACDVNGCDHTVETNFIVTDESSNYTNFKVHLKYTSLTICKNGAEAKDENQSFLFHVTGPMLSGMDVVICGNGSAVIKHLPVGAEYTIIENTNWSWRYEIDDDTQIQKKVILLDEGQNCVIFTNKRKEPYWLSGDCYTENLWGETNIKENPTYTDPTEMNN